MADNDYVFITVSDDEGKETEKIDDNNDTSDDDDYEYDNLMDACKLDTPNIAHQFINEGHNIIKQSPSGRTALHYAAIHKHGSLVISLLHRHNRQRNYSVPDIKDSTGKTFMDYVLENNMIDVLTFIRKSEFVHRFPVVLDYLVKISH